MKTNIAILLAYALLLFASSCGDKPGYKAYIDFNNGKWHQDSTATFTFKITEQKPQHISLLVRNTLNYPFYNLYVKYELLDSSGQTLEQGLKQVQLMHEKTGEPFGHVKKPMGKTAAYYFDHHFDLLPSYSFPGKGIYQLNVEHYMRPESLSEVMAVGIAIDDQGKKVK